MNRKDKEYFQQLQGPIYRHFSYPFLINFVREFEEANREQRLPLVTEWNGMTPAVKLYLELHKNFKDIKDYVKSFKDENVFPSIDEKALFAKFKNIDWALRTNQNGGVPPKSPEGIEKHFT